MCSFCILAISSYFKKSLAVSVHITTSPPTGIHFTTRCLVAGLLMGDWLYSQLKARYVDLCYEWNVGGRE